MRDTVMKNDIIDNLIHLMSTCTNLSNHIAADVKVIDDALCYFSGCKFPFVNGIFYNFKNKKMIAPDCLKNTVSYFSDKNISYIWWWLQQEELPEKTKIALDT